MWLVFVYKPAIVLQRIFFMMHWAALHTGQWLVDKRPCVCSILSGQSCGYEVYCLRNRIILNWMAQYLQLTPQYVSCYWSKLSKNYWKYKVCNLWGLRRTRCTGAHTHRLCIRYFQLPPIARVITINLSRQSLIEKKQSYSGVSMLQFHLLLCLLIIVRVHYLWLYIKFNCQFFFVFCVSFVF